MGKKVKIGKSRRDKYYKLSKDIGYRSRAAFKLIQLNQKYGFLQNSSVLIDLCCAPGGWLQVAAKTMPPSSVLIGIDLVPVKSLNNVELFQEDITTEKCYQTIKKFLKTCKVDCILHDGAPNLGNNWLHDSHSQIRLAFHAFKLAANFLSSGGTFVTKLFRSKDYDSLLWLLRKFFKTVDSTKPQASRNESAEIYVVCQGFIHYNKVDPKFFDPKHIFQEVDEIKSKIYKVKDKKMVEDDSGSKIKTELDQESKDYDEIQKLKFRLQTQDNLDEEDRTLISDVDFIMTISHKKLLKESKLREILLLDPRIRQHASTTEEIKCLCSDLKVHGLGDVRTLVKWAQKLKKLLTLHLVKREDSSKKDELTEDQRLDKRVLTLKSESEKLLKNKRRKIAKLKSKLVERMRLKMDVAHDITDDNGADGLFDLKRFERGRLQRTETAKNDSENLVRDLIYDVKDRDDLKIDRWFDRPAFKWLEENVISNVPTSQFDENAMMIEKKPIKSREKCKETSPESDYHSMEEEEDGDDTAKLDNSKLLLTDDYEDDDATTADVVSSVPNTSAFVTSRSFDIQNGDEDETQSEIEIEPDTQNLKDADEDLKLENPEEMLLATYMVQSKKKKEEILDKSYHRYSYGEKQSNLPDWFVEDEKRHYHKILLDRDALPKEVVRDVYNKYNKQINSRPIKKVIEARARKKSRALKRMAKQVDRAQKFASSSSIMAGVDGNDFHQQTRDALERNLISKAAKKTSKSLSAKRDKIYVVSRGRRGTKGGLMANKGKKGRNTSRKNAKIVKVDRRMKKDDHKRKTEAKHSTKKRRTKGGRSQKRKK